VNALSQNFPIEIYQQADFPAAKLHVGQQLRFVNGQNGFD
jgi:hypothetical protein